MNRLSISLFITVMVVFTGSYNLFSQDYSGKVTEDLPEYNRNAVSFLLMQPDGWENNSYYKQFADFFVKYPVPDKYDVNKIEPRILSMEGQSVPSSSNIKSKLGEEKMALEVLNYVFNADENGQWNFDRVIQRAKYNYSDAEVKMLQAQLLGYEKGSKQYKEILPFLKSNYIFSYNFRDVISYDTYYDRIDEQRGKRSGSGYEPVDRRYTGYMMDAKVAVHKLSLSDETLQYIFTKCWFSDESPEAERAAAMENRKELEIPLGLVSEQSAKIKSSQSKDLKPSSIFYKSDEQLFADLFKKGMDDMIFSVEENVPAFQVRAAIYDTRPIEVKIGKKESLEPDGLYLVYEKQISNLTGGEAKWVRQGAIRAKKVIDNRQVATGKTEPSRFYQISGRKLVLGHEVRERKELGAFLYLGGTVFSPSTFKPSSAAFSIKVDYFVSKYFGSDTYGWKFYAEGLFSSYGFEEDEVPDSGKNNYDVFTSSVGGGLAKEWYFFRNFMFSPYLGLRMEYASFLDSDLQEEYFPGEDDGGAWSNIGIDAGARLGISLSYKVQLVGTVGFAPLKYSEEPFNSDYEIARDAFKSDVSLRFSF